MTVAQIAKRAEIKRNRCSEALRELNAHGHVICLNDWAGCGRVYWLTKTGTLLQSFMCQNQRLALSEHFVPIADWDVYGKV